jgi:long-chain acyl-CoA synthetase
MLKVIVSIDDLSPPARRVASAWAKQHNVELLYMTESTSLSPHICNKSPNLETVEEQGKENRIEPTLPGPDDIATICYTSGTTNVPKGALLSHYNLVSGAIAFVKGLSLDDGIVISYLPLAHIYERINELMVLYGGAAIGYFTGDPLRLLEDIQILKPSYFPSVPRVLNRLALGVQAAMAQPGLKGRVLVAPSL